MKVTSFLETVEAIKKSGDMDRADTLLKRITEIRKVSF
jgi:uncharacterized protein HemY